jgi:hypothetical protein
MRTLKIIVVLLVLIGFPALSWYYLSSGLRWRINAQEATRRKEALRNFTLVDKDSVLITSQEMAGTYYLIARPGDAAAVDHLKRVGAQFGVRHDFRTVILLPGGKEGLELNESAWMQLTCAQGCEALNQMLFEEDYTAAIVDSSLYLRGRYHLSSMQEMRKLVEHLAVVLPIEKRERIELKRGKEQ